MNEYLSLLISSMCGSYFQPLITYRNLMLFTVGALFIIILLNLWYIMISDLKVNNISIKDRTLYCSKKSPFQQEIIEYPYYLKENKNLSLKHKLVLIFFIIVLVVNPLEKLMGLDYFI